MRLKTHAFRIFIAAGSTLALAGCMNGNWVKPTVSLPGQWSVENIQGRPVIDNSPASMLFENNGNVSGNSSCNRMFGQYKPKGDHLNLSAIGTTRMACAPALMDQEQRFLEALERVEHFLIKDGLLYLTDEQDKPVIRLSR
ncbi:MAG: META domain-containing protein [Amphritea sp.]